MDNPNLAVSQPLIPSWQRVDELADLVEVFDPSVQVCAWQREIDPAIATYLANIEQINGLQIIGSSSVDEQIELERLPDGDGRDALLEDLSLLRDIVCELMGSPAVGFRLARLGYAMCPGWHIDRTGIRLVTTYQGPGTEWMENQNIDRQKLGPGMNANQACQQAQTGEIVLLKGSLWQENEHYGAIHRSPEVEADAGLRTVVTIDPLWEE